jgi:uncharacterized protein (DUF697 family)
MCGALSDEMSGLSFVSQVGSISPLPFAQLFTILLLKANRMYNIYKALSVQAQCIKLCPISSSIRYSGSLVT